MHCCARLHVPGARALLFLRTTPNATVCGQGLRQLPASSAHIEHKPQINALQLLTCYKSGLALPLGWEGWAHRTPQSRPWPPEREETDERKTGQGKSQTGNRTVMTTDRGARAAPAAAATAGRSRVSLPARPGLSERQRLPVPPEQRNLAATPQTHRSSATMKSSSAACCGSKPAMPSPHYLCDVFDEVPKTVPRSHSRGCSGRWPRCSSTGSP